MNGRPSLVPFLAGFTGLLAIAVAVEVRYRPPPVRRDQPGDKHFSAERAIRIVRRLLGDEAPRPVGSPGHETFRRRLALELERIGYTPEVQVAEVDGTPIQNIVARRPGLESGPALMLAAHHDSVPAGPGASDDAAGVATLLEVARLVGKGPATRNPLVFLFTDGEELGLLGARAFCEENPLAREVAVVLNFEARGTTGPSILFETGADSGWLIGFVARHVPRPVTNSTAASIYRSMPNDTDLTVFRRHGMAGLNFAFIEGAGRYHTAGDDLEHVDPRSLQHHGDNALSLSRALANADLRERPVGEAVFFDILALWVVHFPEGWTAPISGVMLLSLALLATFLARSGALHPGRILLAALHAPLTVLLAGFAGLVLARLLGAVGLLESVFPDDPGPFVLAYLGAALGTFALPTWAARPYLDFWSWWVGTWGVLGIVAILAAGLVPGASYLVTIPVLTATVVATMVQIPGGRSRRSGPRVAVLPALVSGFLSLPLVKFVPVALGVDQGALTAASLAFVLLPLAPLAAARRLRGTADTGRAARPPRDGRHQHASQDDSRTS